MAQSQCTCEHALIALLLLYNRDSSGPSLAHSQWLRSHGRTGGLDGKRKILLCADSICHVSSPGAVVAWGGGSPCGLWAGLLRLQADIWSAAAATRRHHALSASSPPFLPPPHMARHTPTPTHGSFVAHVLSCPAASRVQTSESTGIPLHRRLR